MTDWPTRADGSLPHDGDIIVVRDGEPTYEPPPRSLDHVARLRIQTDSKEAIEAVVDAVVIAIAEADWPILMEMRGPRELRRGVWAAYGRIRLASPAHSEP